MIKILRKVPRKPRATRLWLSDHNVCTANKYCDACMECFAAEAEYNRPGHLWAVDDGKVIYLEDIVMRHQLGRELKPTESIVHRNGDFKDNRPENLELIDLDGLEIK